MKLRNTATGSIINVNEEFGESLGHPWEPLLDGFSPVADVLSDGLFDPSAHTADEVTEYLNSAGKSEIERVVALERSGKNRKTITDIVD